MLRVPTLTRVAMLCLVVVCGLALMGPFVGLSAADNGTANMTVTTDAETAGTGLTTNATVHAENASSGVSAYELVLTVENQTATITDVTTLAEGDDGPVTTVTYGPNESTVTVTTALLDASHEPAPTIDLLNATVQGEANGTTAIEIAEVTELDDTDVNAYNVTETTNATLNVRAATPITVTPNTSETTVGQPATVTIAAAETPLGVSAYDTSVTVDGNATIENVSTASGANATVNTTLQANGTQANVTVSNASVTQTARLELATLTVNGTAAGPATVSVASGETLTGVNGTAYYPTAETATTLSVGTADDGDDDGSGGGGGGGGAQPPSDDEVMAEFNVSAVTPTTDTVTADETIDIGATIENTGSTGGNQDVELRIAGETVATESVTLIGGGTTEIAFSDVSVPNEAGSVTYDVFTENDSQTGTITVELSDDDSETDTASDTNETTSDDETPDSESTAENDASAADTETDDEIPGFTGGLAVIAMLIASGLLRSRRA